MLAFAAAYLLLGSMIAFLAYALGFVRVDPRTPAWQWFPCGVLVYGAIALGYPLIVLACVVVFWKDTRFD